MRILLSISAGFLLAAAIAGSAPKHASWLDRANDDAKSSSRQNPYEGDEGAVAAGAKLYARYCSACHGNDAGGVGRNPSLRSPTVAKASPGALYWLLRNGSLRRGMPSWSKLPPEQRWQLVSWMRSLQSR